MVYFKRLHNVDLIRDVFYTLFDPLKDLHSLIILKSKTMFDVHVLCFLSMLALEAGSVEGGGFANDVCECVNPLYDADVQLCGESIRNAIIRNYALR